MNGLSFERLLSPGRIGGLELSNRVVLPAMDMNLCDEGMITDGEIAHYTARAAGGVGLAITGSGAVSWPIGATSRHQPGLSDDRFIAGLRALADSVHGALRITGDPARLRKMSKRWMPIGQHVVVVGGGLVGLELAEFLAGRGRTVTVLEEGAQMGLPMAMARRWTAVRPAAAHGVRLERNAVLEGITVGSVAFRVGERHFSVEADDVVIASNVEPDSTLADAFTAAGFNVRVIGDAAEVGYIDRAIHSAWALAEEL